MKYSLFEMKPAVRVNAKRLTDFIKANTTHQGKFYIIHSHDAFFGVKAMCSECGQEFWFGVADDVDHQSWGSVVNNAFTTCDNVMSLVNNNNLKGALDATDAHLAAHPDAEDRMGRLLSLQAAQSAIEAKGHEMGGIIEITNNESHAYIIACGICDKILFVRGDAEAGAGNILDGSILHEPCMPDFLGGMLDFLRKAAKDKFGPGSDVKIKVKHVDASGVHDLGDSDDMSDLGKMLYEAITSPHLSNPLDKRDRIMMGMTRARLEEIAQELTAPAHCQECGVLLGDPKISEHGHHFDLTDEGMVLHFCKKHCPHCGRNAPGQPSNDPHLS